MTVSPPATDQPPLAAGPLRRVPVQDRSLARVQRMLDACAALVEEIGYDRLTTTLLAERARVAIGSVYQFFPDKRAVAQALAQRSLEAYRERLTDRLTAAGGGWYEAVDVALDEYIDMHRAVPGFRALHLDDAVDPHLLDSARDNHEVIAAHIVDVLAGATGTGADGATGAGADGAASPQNASEDTPDGAEVRRALTVGLAAADAVIKLAFRRAPDGEELLLTEARMLVHCYFDPHLPR